MGAGIAYVDARTPGLEVVLVDRDTRGGREGQGLLAQADDRPGHEGPRQDRRPRRAARPHHAERGLRATSQDCDLVVEAVFEDPKVKAEVIAQGRGGDPSRLRLRLEHLDPADLRPRRRLLGTPAEFIGIHFFSPVEKMMLVEIITGRRRPATTALATALDYVRAIRKTPIVVNDSRGFFANRCVGAYILEGHLMLAEGVPPAMIENAGKQAGMPVGPLSLNDEVALDLALKIVRATKAQVGAAAVVPAQEELLVRLVEQRGPPRPQEPQGLLRLSRERPEAPLARPRATSRRPISTARPSTCRN